VEQYPKLSSHPSSVADVQKLPLFKLPSEKYKRETRDFPARGQDTKGIFYTFHGCRQDFVFMILMQADELQTDRAASQHRIDILELFLSFKNIFKSNKILKLIYVSSVCCKTKHVVFVVDIDPSTVKFRICKFNFT